jgi:NADH-quinone oxidoreductase subunit M
MLIPIYFLASGALAVRDNVTLTLKEREEAATKFVIYTLAGSAPLFFAIVYLAKHIYNERGEVSFVLSELLTIAAMPIELELALFLLFAITFAVKLPLFPFHSWLSGLYRSLPLGVLVLVAGVVGKVGIYGLIRFAYPLFPSAAQLLAPGLAWLAAISIVYGALMALVSKRIREILAFSSRLLCSWICLSSWRGGEFRVNCSYLSDDLSRYLFSVIICHFRSGPRTVSN